MKSQGWLPQEGSVRKLLCSDPSCPICNGMALEIQQLLGGESKQTTAIPLRTSQSFSCLEALSSSKVLFDKSSELCSQHSRDISLTSSLTPSQSTDQKSSTQSAAPSTGDANIQYYCPDHHQQKQTPQESNMSQDAGSLSSSSVEESGVPANQQKKRKKNKKLVLNSEAASEPEVENKMTFFSHWVNPEVKCERLEEPIVLPKSEAEAKPEEPKNQTPAGDHNIRADVEQTTEDAKAKPLRAKKTN
ncbi:protein FAM205C [Phodopus roborovskii]|nr:protein FAM205C [Phodopus roborovskii]